MFYLSLIILIIYLTYIFIKFKQIPTSLSDTFYLGANWLFTLTMWIISFVTAISLLQITPITYQFLPFLLSAGLLFVGAAPHFKEEYESKIHYGGAITFGLAANIWSCLYFSPWVLLTWILASYLIFFTKQRTFWIEMVCVINLILAYIL